MVEGNIMQDNLWQAVLGEIELSVTRASYITWFKNTRLLKHSDKDFVIGVPNVFIKQQLEKKFNDLIKQTLINNGVSPDRIEYKIHSGFSIKKQKQANEERVLTIDQPSFQSTRATSTRPNVSKLAHKYRQGLNERYTFENFIVGSGNELAYAACQAIAQSPGTKYNPLFIYGGVGIGKTHLIQAVGNEIMRHNSNAHVVYVSTEQFVQEFIDAVRFKKNTDFASYYRNADVLIIDDMQFIAGKDKTQEEFFHTFNALHQANKQIIISSDKPPKDIPTLEDRLQSRFAWGMSIDMQNPDFETRCAIIQTKAESSGIVLPQEVVSYLAELVQTNIRELEGALNQLLAFCEMRGLSPNVAIARTLLGNVKSRPKHISAKHVVERTARHFHITTEELLGPKRDKDIVVPRQVAMYMLRSELKLSFPKIAKELGRKDHTTAMHSVDKIEREISFDDNLKAAVEEIREKLNA
jgi:chromosomal replication initiator protein